MGQATNGTEKVFHSTDGGSSWTVLSQGYPENIPGNRLLYDHDNGYLYVATDVGIFRTRVRWHPSGPNSWSKVSGSILFKVVTDLEKDYYSDRLIAGTYGRGIWIANLCYDDENPLIIDSDTEISSRREEICSDIIIRNNSTLIISTTVTLSKLGTITIENGSSLIIDGGNLKNGNIIVLNGGNLSVINDGAINLFSGDEVQSELGATMNIDNGSIDLIN